MQRIVKQDVEIRIAYANELLARHGSNVRLHFSRYNDYYKVAERNPDMIGSFESARDFSGTMRECYNYLIGFIRSLNILDGR